MAALITVIRYLDYDQREQLANLNSDKENIINKKLLSSDEIPEKVKKRNRGKFKISKIFKWYIKFTKKRFY